MRYFLIRVDGLPDGEAGNDVDDRLLAVLEHLGGQYGHNAEAGRFGGPLDEQMALPVEVASDIGI